MFTIKSDHKEWSLDLLNEIKNEDPDMFKESVYEVISHI